MVEGEHELCGLVACTGCGTVHDLADCHPVFNAEGEPAGWLCLNCVRSALDAVCDGLALMDWTREVMRHNNI